MQSTSTTFPKITPFDGTRCFQLGLYLFCLDPEDDYFSKWQQITPVHMQEIIFRQVRRVSAPVLPEKCNLKTVHADRYGQKAWKW